MGSNEIRALGNPTTSRSSVTLEYMTGALNRPVSGLDIAGDIDMKNQEITNLADPTTDESAVKKKWVTNHVSGSSLTSSGFTMTGNIDMGGHSVVGLANINLETITIKSNSSILADITNVNL
jgi:transcriptional regulator of aromatic amino acid metabolism